MISKFQVGLKFLLRQGFSEPEFYGDLVYNMFLKGYALEANTAQKNWNKSVHISSARLASFCHLGVISDPLIISKFHNETHNLKGHENKIYTIERRLLALIIFHRRLYDGFDLKTSIDGMVGAWCFGCLSGPLGFTC